MRVEFDLKVIKNFANTARAEQALKQAFDPEFFSEFEYFFAIQDGRIIPVIRCRPHQLQHAIVFANARFYTTN